MLRKSFRNLMIEVVSIVIVMLAMTSGFSLLRTSEHGSSMQGIGTLIIVFVPLMVIATYLYFTINNRK